MYFPVILISQIPPGWGDLYFHSQAISVTSVQLKRTKDKVIISPIPHIFVVGGEKILIILIIITSGEHQTINNPGQRGIWSLLILNWTTCRFS